MPGILTRLDKDTSGLVVIALTPTCMRRCRGTPRPVERKEYLAVVDGAPEPVSGRIALPLARDTADRRRVIVTPTGAERDALQDRLSRDGRRSCDASSSPAARIRSACTWPRADGQSSATGATEQADPTITRQALHAWRVTLPHPITRQREIAVEAPAAGHAASLGPV